MSLGDAYTNTTPNSASKLNNTTNISGTGTYLASLDLSQFKILICTSTGSGFTADHVYLVNADGVSTTDITAIQDHDHTSGTTGGSISDVLLNNDRVLDTGAMFALNPDRTKWTQGTTATASISNDTTSGESSIKLSTGATSGSVASIKQVGIEWDSSKMSFFSGAMKFGTASSLAMKMGFNMENLDVANDNERKYGAEVCTTVNNNFFATTADGTTRSSSDTGIAIGTDQDHIKAEYYPEEGTPKLDLYIDLVGFTKTSNIPTTYTNDVGIDRLWRISFKNNAASDRTMFNYGCRFLYYTSVDWK